MNTARILVVDDEPDVCRIISRWLMAEGYTCSIALRAEQALAILEEQEHELVISDIMMPGMSGMELLGVIRRRFPKVAVFMVTAVDDRRTGIRALELGAYGYVIKPFERNEILINVASSLERREMFLLNNEYEGNLKGHLRDSFRATREHQEVILRTIWISCRSHGETQSHLRRVGRYASLLLGAFRPGQTLKALEDIAMAAAMHDIGKIAIPDRILMKPDRLTAQEQSLMQKHSILAARMFSNLETSLMRLVREIALAHHERWDGSGYPEGLKGEAIPESARIVAVADVFDALIHKRPHRPPFSQDDALLLMKEEKGKQFDPEILDCFFQILPDIQYVQRELSEDSTTGGTIGTVNQR